MHTASAGGAAAILRQNHLRTHKTGARYKRAPVLYISHIKMHTALTYQLPGKNPSDLEEVFVAVLCVFELTESEVTLLPVEFWFTDVVVLELVCTVFELVCVVLDEVCVALEFTESVCALPAGNNAEPFSSDCASEFTLKTEDGFCTVTSLSLHAENKTAHKSKPNVKHTYFFISLSPFLFSSPMQQCRAKSKQQRRKGEIKHKSDKQRCI